MAAWAFVAAGGAASGSAAAGAATGAQSLPLFIAGAIGALGGAIQAALAADNHLIIRLQFAPPLILPYKEAGDVIIE